MQSEDYLNSLLIQFSEAFYLDDFQKLSFLSTLIKEAPVLPSGVESPLLSHVEYQKFQEDMGYFDLVLSNIFSSQWDLISDQNDIQVESHISGADFYTRASVLINANIFESLAVISEVDLLTTWIHALSNVSVISAPGRFRKLMKYDFWFPWPLSNRECLLEFSAFPVPEDQSMLIIMRTPNDSYLNTLLPASQNGSIRMSIPIGCILVKYISPYLTKISILVQANASTIPTNLLPEWLLNFGKKQIMYFLMDSLRKTVLEFKGSEYESKLLSNPEFYGFLKKVLSTDVDIS